MAAEAEAAEKVPLAVHRQVKESGWSGMRWVCCTTFHRLENWSMAAAERLALKCLIHLSPITAAERLVLKLLLRNLSLGHLRCQRHLE